MTRIAAVQMASGPNLNANVLEVERLIGKAAAGGAKLVVLPENFYLMGHKDVQVLDVAEADGEGPLQAFLARQAARHGIWLVAGTVPIRSHESPRARSACLVFDALGRRVARYDKIHLFDVTVVDSDEHYQESRVFEPGDHVVVLDTPFGRLGLSICYDLRFPELYRALTAAGAQIITVPSAFTAATGKAHWEPLLRARAIENLSYVVAAAQGGYHANGRETWGDSLICDPWGRVLDRLPRGSGVVLADIDLQRLTSVRRQFPALEHRTLVVDPVVRRGREQAA